jgi:hypothetical protein
MDRGYLFTKGSIIDNVSFYCKYTYYDYNK